MPTIKSEHLKNDVFYNLSLTARGLYFHLFLSADGDGFIANPKQVMKSVGASESDMNELVQTRYVLLFKSGVICIKHWYMHNARDGNEGTHTSYKEEFDSLQIRSNGAYSEKEKGTCISSHKEEKPQYKANTSPQEYTYSVQTSEKVENMWGSITEVYPKKSGLTEAKSIWLNMLYGVDERNIGLVGRTYYVGILIYLKNYRDKNDTNKDGYKYVPKLSRWLKEDAEYWRKLAEKKLREEGAFDDVGS